MIMNVICNKLNSGKKVDFGIKDVSFNNSINIY